MTKRRKVIINYIISAICTNYLRLCFYVAPPILVVILGCSSSIELPAVEESERTIARIQPQLESTDRAIRSVVVNLPTGSDIITRFRVAALNRILKALADNRSDDIRITFLPTRPLISEQKSILGISYTNNLDIDSGNVSMNLKTFRFDRFENNRIDATLEIEGKGKISASGRYSGVPASASPEVELYLNDKITFDLHPTDSGYFVLKPQQKTLTLKTKFFLKLLEWRIPWNQDIPLQLADVIKPIAIPVALNSEISFPVPASGFDDEKLEYVPYLLNLSKTSVAASGNILEFRSNVDFRKK